MATEITVRVDRDSNSMEKVDRRESTMMHKPKKLIGTMNFLNPINFFPIVLLVMIGGVINKICRQFW